MYDETKSVTAYATGKSKNFPDPSALIGAPGRDPVTSGARRLHLRAEFCAFTNWEKQSYNINIAVFTVYSSKEET